MTVEEKVQERLRSTGYVKAFHISLEETRRDFVKLRMEVTEESKNVFGFVHGGALFGLADTVAGAVALTDGEYYVTQNSNFHFISNVTSGTIVAEGSVIHRGRTIAVIEVRVYSDAGKLLGQGTFDMYHLTNPKFV